MELEPENAISNGKGENINSTNQQFLGGFQPLVDKKVGVYKHMRFTNVIGQLDHPQITIYPMLGEVLVGRYGATDQ